MLLRLSGRLHHVSDRVGGARKAFPHAWNARPFNAAAIGMAHTVSTHRPMDSTRPQPAWGLRYIFSEHKGVTPGFSVQQARRRRLHVAPTLNLDESDSETQVFKDLKEIATCIGLLQGVCPIYLRHAWLCQSARSALVPYRKWQCLSVMAFWVAAGSQAAPRARDCLVGGVI